MSNANQATDLIDDFETAVEEYFLGAEESDAPRQRAALKDMARAAAALEAASPGNPSPLAPLLDHPNEEVRAMADAYRAGILDVLGEDRGVRRSGTEEAFAAADDARVNGLVQTYQKSVLTLWAARKAGDAKAASKASLGLTEVPFALMTMQPSRLSALAVLLEHEDAMVRVTVAMSLMTEMPDRVMEVLRTISARESETYAGKMATSVLQHLAKRAGR